MSQVVIKTADEISLMRDASRIVIEVLDAMERAAGPGVSTWELERIAEELTARRGAKPAFKGYMGFPCCLCASINEEVVHGIPSKKRKLAEGDLLKLDFGVSIRGYFGDAARTVPIGKISEEARALVEGTQQALKVGIEQAVKGNRVGDIGFAVQRFAESKGYSVVRDFVGHGIGRELHEQPQVPNFGWPSTGMKLRPGITLAIEPMVNQGTHKVELLDDEWTAVTLDRKLSAHFEHTVLVTEDGPEILTRLP
ncbi:MAG: type I methionyl aminopeptidase [Myxococcales bacterium]|nr:type I methionyl aminopeptidase [Myxococcales bacterium]